MIIREKDKTLRALTTCSLLCLLIAIFIIAVTPSATGYEVSLYSAFPPFFWILFLVPMVIPIIVVFLDLSCRPQQYLSILTASVGSLLLLLSIPVFRGSVMYGAGDTLTHIAIINDLIYFHHVDASNIYPLTHVYVSIFSQMLNISPELISLFIPQLSSLMFIVSIWILSRSLNYTLFQSFSITCLAIIPILGVWVTTEYIMPSTIGFMFFPLLFYTIIKRKEGKRFLLLFLVLYIFLTYLHPENALYLCIGLIVTLMLLKSVNLLMMNRSKLDLSLCVLVALSILLFRLITMYHFEHYTTMFLSPILGLDYSFPATPPLQKSFEGREIYDLILRTIKLYGQAILFILLGIICLISSTLSIILTQKFKFKYLLPLVIFVIFSIISVVLLSVGTSIGSHIYRQLKYPILFSVILAGLLLSAKKIDWLKNFNTPRPQRLLKVGRIVVFIMIIFASVIAINNMFSSPDTGGFSYQITSSDISGMELFFNNRDEDLLIVEFNRGFQCRFADYILGSEDPKVNIRWPYGDDCRPPEHFGYDIRPQLGSFYEDDQYLLIYPPTDTVYPLIYPQDPDLWIYSPDDFRRLNYDETVDSIQTNGQLKVMVVKTTM